MDDEGAIEMRAVNTAVYCALGSGIIAISFGSILARLAEAPAPAIGALRMAFSSLILLPFVLTSAGTRAELARISRGDLRLLALSGLFLALHFFLWISSLSFTGVTSSVVFVTTNPLWVALYLVIFRKKRISRVFWLGLGISILGGAIIAGRDVFAGGPRWKGDLLALGGAVAIAGYFLVGSGLRGRISLIAYVFPVYTCAAVLLSIAAMASGAPLGGYGWESYGACAIMALVCQILGHSLFNWALRYLEATVVAIAALGEPVGASILALLILGERAVSTEIIGGAAILAGIFYVLRFSPEAAEMKERIGSGS
ncbi:MAG: DMT family transporter [Candidatus Krumholzibacteria bacterium]|nr:DMT family transporter [Candidatus Krumholzibacteria bacterium]